MKVECTLKNYRCFSEEKPLHFTIGGGFTAFVGANNSGKSSVLKFLYDFRNLFTNLLGDRLREMAANSDVHLAFPSTVSDPRELFFNKNDNDLEISFKIVEYKKRNFESHPYDVDRIVISVQKATNICKGRFYSRNSLIAPHPNANNADAIDYTLWRELFLLLSDTLFLGPFRNAITVESTVPYFDIQVGQAFIRQWRQFKTGPNIESNEATYKLTEDVKRVFGFEQLEINPSQDDTTLQFFVDGKSYKLKDLGSGLAQFVLVLATASVRKPSIILIDEPELNLHPTLQLDFLTTLGSYASHGVIFATHSIGLARAAAERVYSVRKPIGQPSEVRDIESTPSLAEFLGELSFTGYKELGFDKILLVEGPTEVRTIQQMLRKYNKEHQIVLLPMGGGSLINKNSEAELLEIKRISDHVAAVIDSERDSADASLEADRQEFVEVCKKVGINCHVLERRATENYFNTRVVQAIKGDKYNELAPYENMKKTSLGWGKHENWKMAREMTKDELGTTDLGEFLRNL